MKIRAITIRFILISALTLLSLLYFSCDGDQISGEDQNKNSRLLIYSGDNQVERINATLPDPLVVRITDLSGNPRSGIEVSFTSSNPGVFISQETALSGIDGIASSVVTLGPTAGQYQISASIEEDIDQFNATAVALECPEEDPAPECGWTEGNIFITTTSSSYITGSGSVLIEFDPLTGETEKLLETSEIIIDLAFSPRGELFLISTAKIFKVDPVLRQLSTFLTFDSPSSYEIEPSFGGILSLAGPTGLNGIFCPLSNLTAEFAYSNINPECLASDPESRDLYFITGTPPTYTLRSVTWDGRSDFGSMNVPVILNTGPRTPRGICSPGQGIFYITLDDDDSNRGIAEIDARSGTVDMDFFDFYTYFGGNSADAGRWGDIAVAGTSLYLLDKRNDRLVQIGTDGSWLNEYQSNVFSMPFIENERYGIAAAPAQDCD
ncbi:MAG: Ig-like domain-containing protein [Candidatus Krumholzibacteriota bacterium]|nr:Ig-like domain-containing protein [Candidatus Krumholzibacteriota bacterium]